MRVYDSSVSLLTARTFVAIKLQNCIMTPTAYTASTFKQRTGYISFRSEIAVAHGNESKAVSIMDDGHSIDTQ